MNGFSKARELNTTAHQLGFAVEILQALIIASERSEDAREKCMLSVAQQAADALKGRLAA